LRGRHIKDGHFTLAALGNYWHSVLGSDRSCRLFRKRLLGDIFMCFFLLGSELVEGGLFADLLLKLDIFLMAARLVSCPSRGLSLGGVRFRLGMLGVLGLLHRGLMGGSYWLNGGRRCCLNYTLRDRRLWLCGGDMCLLFRGELGRLRLWLIFFGLVLDIVIIVLDVRVRSGGFCTSAADRVMLVLLFRLYRLLKMVLLLLMTDRGAIETLSDAASEPNHEGKRLH